MHVGDFESVKALIEKGERLENVILRIKENTAPFENLYIKNFDGIGGTSISLVGCDISSAILSNTLELLFNELNKTQDELNNLGVKT